MKFYQHFRVCNSKIRFKNNFRTLKVLNQRKIPMVWIVNKILKRLQHRRVMVHQLIQIVEAQDNLPIQLVEAQEHLPIQLVEVLVVQ